MSQLQKHPHAISPAGRFIVCLTLSLLMGFLGSWTSSLAKTNISSPKPFNAKGTYHARLGIQGKTADGIIWMERIGYYQEPDSPYVTAGTKGQSDYKQHKVTWTDATLQGNGTYTVSMKAQELTLAIITQLQVSTDIPLNNQLTFTNLTVTINNKTKATYPTVYVDKDKFAKPYTCLLAYNDWRNDLKALPNVMSPLGMPATGEVTYQLSFHVSGFSYDKKPDPTATPRSTKTNSQNRHKTILGLSPTVFGGIAVFVLFDTIFVWFILTKRVAQQKK